MSRPTADRLNQSTMPNIFVTLVRQADGTLKSVMSSKTLCDQSVRVNTHDYLVPIHFLMIIMQSESNAQTFIPSITQFAHSFRKLPVEILTMVFGYLLPINQLSDLFNLGDYATAVRKPTLFLQRKMDPRVIVDAAMRGEENMVLNILRADPSYLLKRAIVKNSVDVKYKVTPLQAAVMANDVQMIEKMHEHFVRLGRLDDNLAEMHHQIKAIYTESLNRYQVMQLAVLKEQEAKQLQLLQSPTDLDETQTKQYEEIAEKIKQTTNRIVAYEAALNCDDIHKIIEAHHEAQEHNAFDFGPYVDAIYNASQTELDDVMALINAGTPAETAAIIARTGVAATQTDEARAKPFDKLTLVEKLNRFREEFVKHMQQEIIFNPNHILTGLRHNEKIWDDVNANRIADPNYQKPSVIFSQLVGWAQRNAAEPVKQDIRQGIWNLTQENEPRSRANRFNDVARTYNITPNSLADVSLVNSSVVDGLGYKFAAWRMVSAAATTAAEHFFQNLCRAKTASFQNLLAASTSTSPYLPVCNSVMR